MTRKGFTNLATLGLIACAVLHAWALIWVLREMTDRLLGGQPSPISWGVMACYAGAATLFNWCAQRGESERYRASALALTLLHLAAALGLGAVLYLQTYPAGLAGELWQALCLLQLPLNGAYALQAGSPAVCWWTAAFYGANLALILLHRSRAVCKYKPA